MSNPKYFDSEWDRDQAAEKLALKDSELYGECDVCPAVAVCSDDKSFKYPSNAACMLRKKALLQAWKELEMEGGNRMKSEYIILDEAMSIPVLPKEHRIQLNNVDEAFEEGWKQALENLANLPAVDVVEVRHGCWEQVRSIIPMYECDKCHAITLGGNYCPNCGAKMDGGKNDG